MRGSMLPAQILIFECDVKDKNMSFFHLTVLTHLESTYEPYELNLIGPKYTASRR